MRSSGSSGPNLHRHLVPIILVVTIMGGFFLRLLVILRTTTIELDGVVYAAVADQLTKGQFGAVLNSVFPPVYPAFIGFSHLLIPDVEIAGRIVSLFFGMALPGLIYAFVGRLTAAKEKAVWAVVLVIFHPFLILYSGQVLSESLATFLFAASAFSFYIGWQEHRRFAIAIAGLCLCLTYFTRPEYIVYYVPFALFLIPRKRFVDIIVLILPFFLLGTAYVLYLHSQTGLWMISNKATQSPFVSFTVFLRNVPFVSYEFLVAFTPILVILGLCGIKFVSKPYGKMVVLLLIFHVISLSFVSHATKRYSVEFIPILVIFSVEGVYFLIRRGLKWHLSSRVISALVVVIVILFSIFQSNTTPRFDRALHKEAGLYLKNQHSRGAIASRLPLVAFYANNESINLMQALPDGANAAKTHEFLTSGKAAYLVVDVEIEKDIPSLKSYLSERKPIKEFINSAAFLRVYRLSDG
jgi:hypothetical protein